MDLNTLIRECATSEGADFFGVADVVPAREAIREQGGDLVASFPRAVSIGMKLFHPIVDQLPRRFEDTVHAQNYAHHCYTVINQRLDLIASRVANLLQKQRPPGLPGACLTDHKHGTPHGSVFEQDGGAHGRPRVDRQELPAGHTGNRSPLPVGYGAH